MAEGLIPSLIPQTVGGVLGLAGSGFFGATTLWLSIRKARVDETSMILAKWKEMNDRHEADVKELRDELRSERAENALLRERLLAAEKTIAGLNRKINAQDDTIAGLVRQLAQMGQSTLTVLGGPNAGPTMQRALGKLDEEPGQ